jgi:uncharacterized protein
MNHHLGFGLGLRPDHYSFILENNPDVDWFEAITEDYLAPGGRSLHYLLRIRERYPIVMHGVSLSIASCDPLNWTYLRQVSELAQRLQPEWISDHLCWTGVDGLNMHDLLPFPFTQETLDYIVQRVKAVQDYLGRKILLENVSSYITFKDSTFTEWEFLAQIAQQADCFILLDINNLYVNSVNHGFDPDLYLKALPKTRVRQFHLAGHQRHAHYIIDTHDAPIVDPVWRLYQAALEYFGPVATMIERDDHIPPFPELLDELNYAKQLADVTLRSPVPL